MSDWGAVNDRVKGLEAGLDLEMPSSNGVNDSLIVQAVKDGSLKEDILDEAVERILRIILNIQTTVHRRTSLWKKTMKKHATLRKNLWFF